MLGLWKPLSSQLVSRLRPELGYDQLPLQVSRVVGLSNFQLVSLAVRPRVISYPL